MLENVGEYDGSVFRFSQCYNFSVTEGVHMGVDFSAIDVQLFFFVCELLTPIQRVTWGEI